MRKSRPESANPTRQKSQTTSHMPSFTAKNDLKLIQSSGGAANFLDNEIFKLTEALYPDHKTIASTQISQELHSLKIFTNQTQFLKTTTAWKINKLSLELEQVKTTEIYGQKFSHLLNCIEVLKAKIAAAKKQQLEKLADREIYYHIEKRLGATKIHLDLKRHFLQNKLNIKESVLKIEKERFLKVRELRCKSARMYRNFDKSSGYYIKNKAAISDKLEKEKELVEGLEESRIQRHLRHIEICGEVDNEETIRKYKGIREKIMICRLWHSFLSHKTKQHLVKFGTIETAFRKIRSVTGLYNISEVVEKFLTKENSYQELMKIVIYQKGQKDLLLKRNEDLSLKIENFNMSEKTIAKAEVVQQLYRTISLAADRRMYDKAKIENLNRIRVGIENWIKKIVFEIDGEEIEGGIRQLIEVMREKVVGKLREVKGKVDFRRIKMWDLAQAGHWMKNTKLSKFVMAEIRDAPKDREVNLAELNYIDELMEQKKRTFFMPLLEKALRR